MNTDTLYPWYAVCLLGLIFDEVLCSIECHMLHVYFYLCQLVKYDDFLLCMCE